MKQILTEEQKNRLEEIAESMGITLTQLFETDKDPDVIIDEYDNKTFKILNEKV